MSTYFEMEVISIAEAKEFAEDSVYEFIDTYEKGSVLIARYKEQKVETEPVKKKLRNCILYTYTENNSIMYYGKNGSTYYKHLATVYNENTVQNALYYANKNGYYNWKVEYL